MKKQWMLVLAAAALLGFAAPSQAQVTLYIGAGGSFPTSDFGDYAKTGWMATGGALWNVGDSGLGIGAELFYGQNNHDEDVSFFEGAKTSPYGAMAIVDYSFETGGNIHPYVFGGLGLLVHRFSADNVDSESDSQFGYQGGAGLAFGLGSGSTSLYIEGRYMGSEDTKYFGALAGLAFGVGN